MAHLKEKLRYLRGRIDEQSEPARKHSAQLQLMVGKLEGLNQEETEKEAQYRAASVLVAQLGLVLFAQLCVHVAGRSCVHLRSANVVEHQHLFLARVICFATSLDLTFICCLSRRLLGLFEAVFCGSFLAHIHLPVLLHLQCTRFPHHFRFLPAPARSPPLLEHSLPCSRSCPHSPRRLRWSISLLSSPPHGRLPMLSCLFASSRSPSSSLSFRASGAVARVVHVLIWLIILVPPLHLSLCLAPS